MTNLFVKTCKVSHIKPLQFGNGPRVYSVPHRPFVYRLNYNLGPDDIEVKVSLYQDHLV